MNIFWYIKNSYPGKIFYFEFIVFFSFINFLSAIILFQSYLLLTFIKHKFIE